MYLQNQYKTSHQWLATDLVKPSLKKVITSSYEIYNEIQVKMILT